MDKDALKKFVEDNPKLVSMKPAGKSVLNPHQEREGIVFKDVFGGRAISNKYLLGEK
jgi:hypothetical protein